MDALKIDHFVNLPLWGTKRNFIRVMTLCDTCYQYLRYLIINNYEYETIYVQVHNIGKRCLSDF